MIQGNFIPIFSDFVKIDNNFWPFNDYITFPLNFLPDIICSRKVVVRPTKMLILTVVRWKKRKIDNIFEFINLSILWHWSRNSFDVNVFITKSFTVENWQICKKKKIEKSSIKSTERRDSVVSSFASMFDTKIIGDYWNLLNSIDRERGWGTYVGNFSRGFDGVLPSWNALPPFGNL